MGNRVIEMLGVAHLDFAWMAKFLSLLVLPATNEDIAILLGGFLVVNRLMPVGIVVAAIFIGMVASDLALYGIGAGARRVPWLGRWAVSARVAEVGGLLQRNLLGLAGLGRVVPGAIFVVMISCGWTRVPLPRVILASVFSSALYLPIMLYLVIVFGGALDARLGWWSWPLLLCLILTLGFMRYRVFTFREKLAARPSVVDTSALHLTERIGQRPVRVRLNASPTLRRRRV